MKRIIVCVVLILLMRPFVNAQKKGKGYQISVGQKKPTIMILPSDNWCEMRYYMTTYDDQGTKIKIPNYQQAFTEDPELKPVISKVGQLLTSLGYSLKDAEQGIKSIQMRTAEDNMTTSNTSGASLIESPLDILKRRLKSDIVIQISWTMGRSGDTFSLEAFDAYTNKRIATSTGTMTQAGTILDMLYNDINAYIMDFDKQMVDWYKDMSKNGREIILTVRCWDNWDKNLETEYDGEELMDCIQKWMQENTVNGSFNLTDGTESFLQFEQVRIPLANESGVAMDARSFGTKLRKYLGEPPYNITAKVMQRGLGEVILVLGEK
jgi:hypothetical protein